jgi:hypothetical protein
MNVAWFTDAEVAQLAGKLVQDEARARYLRTLGLRVDRRPGGGLTVWRPGQGPGETVQNPPADDDGVVVGLQQWAAKRGARGGQKTQRR